MRRTCAAGNWARLSRSITPGSNSVCAKSRAASCTARCSSVRLKFKPDNSSVDYAQKTQLAHAPNLRCRKLGQIVALDHAGQQFGLRKIPRGFLYRPMLFREVKV